MTKKMGSGIYHLPEYKTWDERMQNMGCLIAFQRDDPGITFEAWLDQCFRVADREGINTAAMGICMLGNAIRTGIEEFPKSGSSGAEIFHLNQDGGEERIYFLRGADEYFLSFCTKEPIATIPARGRGRRREG